MPYHIDLLTLGAVALVFGGHGVRYLILAYRTSDFREWIGRAFVAATSVLTAGAFAFMLVTSLNGPSPWPF